MNVCMKALGVGTSTTDTEGEWEDTSDVDDGSAADTSLTSSMGGVGFHVTGVNEFYNDSPTSVMEMDEHLGEKSTHRLSASHCAIRTF